MADQPARSPLGREFHRFWAAAAISNLGDGIRLAALPLLALSLTDDARLIALVNAASLLPWFLLGPLGGVLVDRADRRRLMISGQLLRAALVIVLVAVIARDAVTIELVIAVALGLGVGELVVDASAQAAIPQLVEPDQLDRANGRLIAAITVLDQVVGVSLGAVLFARAASLPFAVDAVTFVLGATLLATVRRPLQGERPPTRPSVRSDLAEGFQFLIGHRLLRGMVVAVSLSNLAGNLSFGVLVVLVVDEIGASEAVFGLVLGVGAIGGVIGSFVAGRLAQRFGRRALLTSLPVVLIVSYLLNAVATAAWMVTLAFGIASAAIVVFNVPAQSIRQAITPDHLLGRVVTSFRTVGLGGGLVGAVLGGVITEASSVRVANVAAAGVGVLAVLAMFTALRHLDEYTDR